jgi:hypothetical protein
MPKMSFDELVRREQEVAKSEKAINWEKEKARWLKDLSELYRQVTEFLQPYVDAKQLVIRLEKIQLVEENLGSYTAQNMIIVIGRQSIKLQPIGTLLIGSRGRVDVIGTTGQGQLMLLSERITDLSDLITVTVNYGGKPPAPRKTTPASEINWVWRILKRPPVRTVLELNRENFLAMLTEISNG